MKQRTGIPKCLKLKNLHVSVEGTEILKGIDLSINPGEVHAIMGPNGSGKSTLASVLAGREEYEITAGEIIYMGSDLNELDAETRAREGIFLAFQYPVEIPGVSNTYFLRSALNAIRNHRGETPLDAMDFLTLVKEKAKTRQTRRESAQATGQRGLLGRREEAQRDLPHGGARAQARDPR